QSVPVQPFPHFFPSGASDDKYVILSRIFSRRMKADNKEMDNQVLNISSGKREKADQAPK
ncbi:MAG: hypothetical protein PHF93_11300, partial [Acidobacteriota bacterium]|nr:hypothetical protein [Acidobacteriota bacterium]